MPGHDAVVHFAAESHVDRSIDGAGRFVDTNVLGTQVLLDAARASTASAASCTSPPTRCTARSTRAPGPRSGRCAPNSPYSASKAASDLLALAYHRTHGMDVVVTRCSNNYGPYQFPEKVIPLFVTNLLDGRKVPLYGDGGNIRDWLHVDDHCRGIDLVLRQGRAGEVYNIGGGTELTNRELTGLLLDACRGGLGHGRARSTDRKGHDLRYSLDIGKIRERAGLRPAGRASSRAWPTPSPGTATTAPGGSRSRPRAELAA